MNTQQLIETLKYIGTDRCEIRLDIEVDYNGAGSRMGISNFEDHDIPNQFIVQHRGGIVRDEFLKGISHSLNYHKRAPDIRQLREVLQCYSGDGHVSGCFNEGWSGTIKVGSLILNALNGDVRYDEKRPHFNLLTGKELSLTDNPAKMKKYAQAQVDKNKHLSDINIMIGKYKGTVILPPTDSFKKPMSDEAKQAWNAVVMGLGSAVLRTPVNVSIIDKWASDLEWQTMEAVVAKMITESECQQTAATMLTPTVSDVMDRVTNLTLRGQIFKIVGLHAPNYTEVADLGQKWMDAIGNLLKVSNGSTFYVSGRTQAADGTMYYAPTHQATSFLLMVAAEKGDACKSKGVYNAESDIGEVLTLMHRFGGFQNPAYTVFYDAEHVYPGVVP